MRSAFGLVVVAAVCCGCGSVTNVWLECPSPDRSTVAVVFSEFGGGAAGWAFFTLALQPAGLLPTVPARFGGGLSLEVLRVDSIESLTLDWTSDRQLAVDAAYDEFATVYHMVHQYPLLPVDGERRVRIMFNEHPPTANERSHTRVTCRSGGLEVRNPPLKRLRED